MAVASIFWVIGIIMVLCGITIDRDYHTGLILGLAFVGCSSYYLLKAC